MTSRVWHLSVEDLEARVRGARDAIERSHCQTIWLLAQGHETADVAEIMAFSARWVNKLLRRYEQGGEAALGDLRQHNPGGKPLLSDEDLEALRERLKTPPADGGLWSGPKVARWMAERLGVEKIHAPRGWEALKKLGWSLQRPRPKNPKAATPEEQDAFKKSLPVCWPKKRPSIPACRSRSGRRTNIGLA